MADNPLLPQDRLRELHALIERIRTIDRRRSNVAREALLAATLIHLSAGDLVSGAADDRTLGELAPKSTAGDDAHDVPQSLRIPLCAGAARGMQTAGTDRLAIAFVEAGAPENGWQDALRWAHRDRLPFLLIVADNGMNARRRRPTNSSPAAAPLLWPELTKLGHSLHLPHFPVDGEDAVAVYRVMQETSARARSGGGPSVIWAMLTAERLAPRQQPLKRLEAYMAARKIRL
ncbi:MAG TPA: thiamine pyrophosphate-dependent enzyme [Acidobacteriaceae bacterium]|nr:thiamine pyrophosphate-dependent enzyme [Acidobacteriaceae bacterium]